MTDKTRPVPARPMPSSLADRRDLAFVIDRSSAANKGFRAA